MSSIQNAIEYVKLRFRIGPSEQSIFTDVDQTILSKNQTSNLRTYESRLLPRLSIFAMTKSLETGTVYQKKINRIHIIHGFIKCLRVLGGIRAYAELSNRLIPSVKKYALNDIGISMSRILVYHYGGYEYNNAKYKKFSELRDVFIKEQEIEVLSEKHYVHVLRNFNRKKSFSKEDIRELEKINLELSDLTSELGNPYFERYKLMLRMIEADLKRDDRKVHDVCKTALDFFESIPYNFNHGKQIFTSHLSRLLIRQKKYDEAEHKILESMSLYTVKSYPWARNLELLFLVHLRQLNIANAEQVLLKIESMKGLKSFGSEMRDRVYLHRLYLSIMTGKKWGKVRTIISDLQRYSHDLKGMNMSLIIAELIHSILNKDFEYIIDQRENIQVYMNRYGGQNTRSKTFIRMILHLPYANLDWYKWIKYTNRMYGTLKKSTDRVEEIEMIDYEVLWPKLLEIALEKNKRYGLYKSAKDRPLTIAGLQ